MITKAKSQEINLDNFLKYSSLIPTNEIKAAKLNHFSFEKVNLPNQVKLLIKVTNPDSINSGSIIFQGEELFWISSAVKIVLFNPKKISNVKEYDIDYPVQIVFSYNLYIILSHINSSVTLLSFTSSFSQMFQKEKEDYNYIKNKAGNLNSDQNSQMLRSVPSSFGITAAQENFIGCNDGVIRTYQIVGHWPDSNFFIRNAIVNNSFNPLKKKIPIISLKRAGNFLYSLDASYSLSAYIILNENQITPADAPIRLSGKYFSMTPFKNSVILTRQSTEGINCKTLLVSTVLDSKNWYRVRKDGVIVSRDFKSDCTLKKFRSNHSIVYYLNTPLTEGDGALWPINYKKLENTVIIYLDYKQSELNFFECDVKNGDIVVFAYNDIKPIPFIDMNKQIIPFSVIENKQNSVQFYYKKDGEEKSISVKTIEFVINEFDDNKESEINNDEKLNNKNTCLAILESYSVCPFKSFGISSITHSIWSSLGSLFCIIESTPPHSGKLLTMQFGINPTAILQGISGRIYAYTTNDRSQNDDSTNDTTKSKISDFSKIPNNIPESVHIFTSECLLKVSLNNQSSYFQRVAWNSIIHLSPYWMKKASVKNISDFCDMLQLELKFCPETDTINKFTKNLKKNCKEEEVPSQNRIRALIKDYNSVKNEVTNFNNNKNSQKPKTPKQHQQKEKITKANSNFMTEQQDTEKEIRSFYDEFKSIAQKRNIHLMKEFVNKHALVPLHQQQFQSVSYPQSQVNSENIELNEEETLENNEQFSQSAALSQKEPAKPISFFGRLKILLFGQMEADTDDSEEIVSQPDTQTQFAPQTISLPDITARRYQIDCLSTWIGDEINNLIEDEESSEYLECLANIQEGLMNINVIFE